MNDNIDLPAPFARRIRLLLVEDDAAERDRLAAMLEDAEGAEFEVTRANALEEALKLLQGEEHDVVLLDLTLPEGQGLDAYLRARVAASSVPIVVMTDEHEDFLATQALRLGAQDYITKGELRPEDLARTLRHAVERHHLFRDLTMAREREHFLATHDSLTELPNRYSFHDHLSQALAYAARQSKRLAVLFIDLDGFKRINDSLGHGVGDRVLRKVAQRLAGTTRRSDILSRVGGDEFVLTVQDIDEMHGAATVAEKVLEALSRPIRIDSAECWVSASIGIATYPSDGSDADGLMRAADLAMYHAKAQGRNRYKFYLEGMNSAASERFELVNSLRDAIARGELELHYQPQIDVERRSMVAAEALVRWRHPERGLVAPGEFIPIAEETGLVVPLGEWVLRNACRAAMSWGSSGAGRIRVGVNISARQLCQPDFVERVVKILDETGLEPARLELEITETSVLHEASGTRTTLRELREQGVLVATDDFGTGYASLSLLKDLPLDRLKIDQSFVRSPGGRDGVIAKALIEMATGLGVTPVAEGVEAAEQLRFLYERGCREMQGFLFARPMPAEDFLRLVQDGATPWTEAIDAALG